MARIRHRRRASSPTPPSRSQRQAQARRALEEIELQDFSTLHRLQIRANSTSNLAANPDFDFNAMELPQSKYCWQYFFLKGCALAYMFGMIWLFSPLVSWIIWGYPESEELEWLSHYKHDVKYFSSFTGYDECGFHMSQLYGPPENTGRWADINLCTTRPALLEAMSDGGRIGFDTAYSSKDCQHRWFTPQEICVILARFDNVIFVGDESLQTIYAGLNILLLKDLLLGALNTGNMTHEEISHCHCQNQFARRDCRAYLVGSSTDGSTGEPSKTPHKSRSTCSRWSCGVHYIPHNEAPLAADLAQNLKALIPAKKKAYKPIPIIHSLTYATHPPLSIAQARRSLTDLLDLADNGRKTPILTVGPAAPEPDELNALPRDHFPYEQADEVTVNSKTPRLNAAQFSYAMRQVAAEESVEWLGMWNVTLQTSHHGDFGMGPGLGEGVAITQAMMVVNWLSRLPSS